MRVCVGAIAYRRGVKGTEVCLISSRRHKGKFTFPKGTVKKGESLKDAVKRELYEEAGVTGKVKSKYRHLTFYKRPGDDALVIYFLVKIKNSKRSWPEKDQRQRTFVRLSEFRKLPLGDAPSKMYRKLKRIGALNKPALIPDGASDKMPSRPAARRVAG